MRTKRQPTIKTLLLLMAMLAIQCAATPAFIELNYSHSKVTWDEVWWTFCGGYFFWSAIPMAIALYCRTAVRAGLLGFEFGLMWVCAYFYRTDYATRSFYSNASREEIVNEILCGPFGILSPLANRPPDRTFPIPEIASYFAVLVVYMMINILFAKSCRLREQSKSTNVSNKPGRRWHPLGARTTVELVVFLLVPLLWVGYRLNWIRQRHEALSVLQAKAHVYRVDYSSRLPSDHSTPCSLKLFGETGVETVWCKEAPSPELVDRMHRLFPELEVWVWVERTDWRSRSYRLERPGK